MLTVKSKVEQKTCSQINVLKRTGIPVLFEWTIFTTNRHRVTQSYVSAR